MYRMRSRTWSNKRVNYSVWVPSFMENLQLDIYPVYLRATQAASHLQEFCMSSIWSSGQHIEQVFFWTLR